MHPNEQLLERLYTAFAARDHAAMASCYAPDAAFGDPVFPDLRGWRVAAMWQMLCEQGRDLELTHDGIEADDHEGRARWEARYTFRPTRRVVHNRIEARFRFEGGRIVDHRDDFDLTAWMRQAIPMGGAVARVPPLVALFRRRVDGELDRFAKKRGLGPG